MTELSTPYPITAEALLYESYSAKTLSTGISKLDLLLDGGMHPGEIIEIYGKSNSGKTELCYKLLASIFNRSEKRTSCLFVDLHNDFSACRLLQYCDRQSSSQIVSRFCVIQEFGIDGLQRSLNYLQQELCRGDSPFFDKLRVVIIDALPFAFYPIMDSSNPVREQQENIVKLMRRLGGIYGLTFIVVNHAVAQSETVVRKTSKNIKAALGKYWSHVPDVRICLVRNGNLNDITGPFGTEPRNTDIFRATLEKTVHGQTERYFDFTITEHDII